ncbi:hypothetical protein CYLTODRAFT_443420 [Cylindrobasidium torrendii FP15055 ss-10]|uniref:Stealth protein CR3 conserved region 3 domain-containing protein n=1 Tax=Cylindrobasidium torrendii FP15055 ss-10 TaxID=1314674 RepID=A0A0D7BFA5_9AGAR|nr:hypothetical protein CYLTODRAFT_443420 [Cylindrobasidium torrendii FP15055 ss-10]
MTLLGLSLPDQTLRSVRRPLVYSLTVVSVLLTLYLIREEPLQWVQLSAPHTTSGPSTSLEESLAMVEHQGILYDPFRPKTSSQLVKDFRIRPIRAHSLISDECLDHWVSTSVWDGPCAVLAVDEAAIDIIWTWTNGSDPFHEHTRSRYIGETGHHPKNARFREHDELRFSLRSAMLATSAWKNSAWHVITPDVEDPQDGSKRLGLLPQWVNTNTSAQRVGDRAPITFHHDSQLFRYARTGRQEYDPEEVEEWRAKVLPTFNSHAIEAQFSNLDPKVVSENIITTNDDQYLLIPMPPSAFHSPLYGPVLRLDRGIKVGGDDKATADGGGEWLSLGWTAHQLNQRFGTRQRSYVVHDARSFSLPLMHEVSLAFADQFTYTALSRFRGMHNTPPEVEINTIFISTHWIIERHREALLWSWVVAKWGGRDGTLTAEKKKQMWLEMGGVVGEDVLSVTTPTMKTTRERVTSNFENANLQSPASPSRSEVGDTEYSWTSHDGHQVPYSLQRTISRELCLGSASERAWDRFLDLAQRNIGCGDAILTMLKTTSQSLGLEVFLPPASTPMRYPGVEEPLTLPLVLPNEPLALPVNPRAWAVRLIHRYSYALGSSPTKFFGITTLRGAKSQMKGVDAQTDLAFLCINDDMPERDEDQRDMDQLYRSYLRTKLPVALDCETD